MARLRIMSGKKGFAPALLAVAGMVLAIPATGLALGGGGDASNLISNGGAMFTPANVDPQLAQRVAYDLAERNMRFTPAGGNASRERIFTVAVRVDDVTARAISVRSAAVSAQSGSARKTLNVAPTRYNLGISRGYRSFTSTPGRSSSFRAGSAAPASAALPASVRKLDMPDLADFRAEFRPSQGSAEGKPSRFQTRIALETEQGSAGRTPGTLDALGEQSVDVGAAYRIMGNLNVTAGVRISQERDRLAPLTDDVQDSQAVYVGTQFRF